MWCVVVSDSNLGTPTSPTIFNNPGVPVFIFGAAQDARHGQDVPTTASTKALPDSSALQLKCVIETLLDHQAMGNNWLIGKCTDLQKSSGSEMDRRQLAEFRMAEADELHRATIAQQEQAADRLVAQNAARLAEAYGRCRAAELKCEQETEARMKAEAQLSSLEAAAVSTKAVPIDAKSTELAKQSSGASHEDDSPDPGTLKAAQDQIIQQQALIVQAQMACANLEDQLAQANAASAEQQNELAKLARRLAEAEADAVESRIVVEAAQSATHMKSGGTASDLQTSAGRVWLNLAAAAKKEQELHEAKDKVAADASRARAAAVELRKEVDEILGKVSTHPTFKFNVEARVHICSRDRQSVVRFRWQWSERTCRSRWNS
eukprot:SAG31_NODE_3139_length_4631_cov_3.420565_1_plen_377_part_00